MMWTLGSTMAPRLASTLVAVPRMASALAAMPRMAPQPASSLSESFNITPKSFSGVQSPLAGHPESFFTEASLVWSNLPFLGPQVSNGGETSTST